MLILIASKITMFVSSSQQSNCICQNVLVWTDTVFYDPSRNFTRLSNPRLPSALPKCNSCEFAHEDSRFALRDFCDMLKRREWSTMVSSSLKPCDPRAVLLFCHFMRRLRVRRLNSAFFFSFGAARGGGLVLPLKSCCTCFCHDVQEISQLLHRVFIFIDHKTVQQCNLMWYPVIPL